MYLPGLRSPQSQTWSFTFHIVRLARFQKVGFSLLGTTPTDCNSFRTDSIQSEENFLNTQLIEGITKNEQWSEDTSQDMTVPSRLKLGRSSSSHPQQNVISGNLYMPVANELLYFV